uniref:phytol kinase 1, chloroplastic n=1 Tax=Erigeron canadensis TaxID=72917 RepID=UPI001CB90574|nr:phytol kinase 1, chloroplastic [Erigeron canadensis]
MATTTHLVYYFSSINPKLRPPPLPPRHTCRLYSSFLTPRYPICYQPSVVDDVPNHHQLRRLFSPCAFAGDVSGHLLQDAGATFLIVAGAYALVSGFDYLTQQQIIQQSLSRKLVHILSGLLYMGSWPLFSGSTDARYFAALVPLLNCARLLVHGFSLVTNEDLIKSVTREGKPEELLKGPLYYVLMLIVCSLFFWRESPVGVLALSMMCGGDGIADIMGRRFGTHKIPYNLQKSWCGSISMFIVGFLISIGMLYYFSIFGYLELDWSSTIERVALVALVATLVESLPTKGGIDDNISVPLASMATAYLSFGFQV